MGAGNTDLKSRLGAWRKKIVNHMAHLVEGVVPHHTAQLRRRVGLIRPGVRNAIANDSELMFESLHFQ
jgi:hypothetical protein